MAYEREIEVRNKEGLHFRPIMRLVDEAGRFTAQLVIASADREADARSPMELLMLVATQGTRLRIRADGEDEQAAVAALAALFESGFGESGGNSDGGGDGGGTIEPAP